MKAGSEDEQAFIKRMGKLGSLVNIRRLLPQSRLPRDLGGEKYWQDDDEDIELEKTVEAEGQIVPTDDDRKRLNEFYSSLQPGADLEDLKNRTAVWVRMTNDTFEDIAEDLIKPELMDKCLEALKDLIAYKQSGNISHTLCGARGRHLGRGKSKLFLKKILYYAQAMSPIPPSSPSWRTTLKTSASSSPC